MEQFGQTVVAKDPHKNFVLILVQRISMTLIDFFQIEGDLEPVQTIINWNEPLKQETKLTTLPPWRSRKWSFWEQFHYCLCGHRHAGDKCYAEQPIKCSCTKLVYGEADMEITFTLADVFEIENPDHSERDSNQWWIEFGEWYEKQKTIE